MKHSIEQIVLSKLQPYCNEKLVLAYSGGVDSQVLLTILATLKKTKKLNVNVRVCHIHHGLNSQADQWLAFAKQQSKDSGFEFIFKKVVLSATKRTSVEEQAREARYQALNELTQPNETILTAHHLDDQAETFLLALKRGSGVKGLSAMRDVVQLKSRTVHRPLLTISRDEIEAYAAEHQLTWVEDDSNLDYRFDRNFIRHQIIPALAQRWPAMAKNMARSIEHCQEADTLLSELAEQDLKTVVIGRQQLSLNGLLALSPLRLKNALRYFLAKNNCQLPSNAQLMQVLKQLTSSVDKQPAIKVGSHWLRRYKNTLYLTENYQDVSDWVVNFDLSTQKQFTVRLPDAMGELHFQHIGVLPQDTGFCESKKITKQSELKNTSEKFTVVLPRQSILTVKFSHQNPTCLPDYRQHSRPLKKVLQELNIPVWQRKRIPFIVCEQQLVAALPYFICQPFSLSKKTIADNTDEHHYVEIRWLQPR